MYSEQSNSQLSNGSLFPERCMKTPRIDVGKIRRGQIVEAAVAVITERGIQHLSLSAIEKRAGMSRGQLTYYYRTKEKILLAVFDHLLELMYERIRSAVQDGTSLPCDVPAWERIRHLLGVVLLSPPVSPEFHCLQHTFLSQISHREDFRERLAILYEEWRTHMGDSIAKDLVPARTASPRGLASLVQALLHGLSMQIAADPKAFDREEMLELCLGLLGPFFLSINGFAGVKKNGVHRKMKSRSASARSVSPAVR
jgi:AcrR family transcriptional regulator